MKQRARSLAIVVAVISAAALLGRWSAHGRIGAQGQGRDDDLRAAIVGGTARHVILFLGDGMGDSEITLARNYALGARGRLALDSLPFTGAMTTYAVHEQLPELPDYVSDSASTGTAWATGAKTSNGRIATTAGSDRDLTTILELAQQRGLRTGIVTTAEITDATPAVLAAHVASRSCQGPADMAACPQDRKRAGGPGSIAEQEIDHRVDVLLGGGSARFAQPTDEGPSVLERAIGLGYRIVKDAAGLESVKAGERLLGLFAPGNMTTEWKGLDARPHPSNLAAPQVCHENQRPATEPSLAQMTAKALELLRGASGEDRFFLQVEGASIDKQNHQANPCAQIGETIAFDRAVRIGIDYARRHPETLVIVTADHGHTSQIVPLPTDGNHPTGFFSVLMTADKTPMAVSYGTNVSHRSQEHTGTQVRVAAMGPNAAHVVGVVDQTDLFHLMARITIGEASSSRR